MWSYYILYFVCIFSSKKYFWSEGLLLLNEKMLCHLRLDSFQFLNSRKVYSKSYHACSRNIIRLFWFLVGFMISLDIKCIWLKPNICRPIEEGRLLPILPLHEMPDCGNAAPGSAGQTIFCTGLSAAEWSCERPSQGSGCCRTAGTAATTAWSGWDDRREDSPFEARTPQRTTYAHAEWGKSTEYIKSLIPNPAHDILEFASRVAGGVRSIPMSGKWPHAHSRAHFRKRQRHSHLCTLVRSGQSYQSHLL